MRLENFHVTNFRSVEDSGVVAVGDEVCLVGKNEAGKTAILNALCGLNPHPSTPFAFDKEQQYPRRYLNEYETRHKDTEATIISTLWRLDNVEQEELAQLLGPDCIQTTEEGGIRAMRVEAFRRYGDATPQWNDNLQYKKILKFLITKHDLDEDERSPFVKVTTTDELRKALEALETPTERQTALLEYIRGFPGKNAIGAFKGFLSSKLPYFMYFSHYDRMAGQIRLDNIQGSVGSYFRQRSVPAHKHSDGYQVPAQNYQEPLNSGELVFMDFLEFAGTSLEEIRNATTYESLNAKCEGASNSITDQLRDYWTQNPFLEIDIRVTKAEPNDAPPFNEGTIARARVRNTLHRVSDFVVVPMRASVIDLDASEDAVRYCRTAGVPYAIVFNQCKGGTAKDNLLNGARTGLINGRVPVAKTAITLRTPFITSMAVGKSGAEKDEAAAREIDALWREIKAATLKAAKTRTRGGF